jgi:uncharacterized protein YnzC (UPF0291/DUF896 family)
MKILKTALYERRVPEKEYETIVRVTDPQKGEVLTEAIVLYQAIKGYPSSFHHPGEPDSIQIIQIIDEDGNDITDKVEDKELDRLEYIIADEAPDYY